MTVAPAAPVRGYRLSVPAWWDRIDLTSTGRERVVENLLARQFRGLDAAAPARQNATRLLLQQVGQAHDVGGLELHLSARAVAGVVVPVSLLVHAVPGGAVRAERHVEPWSSPAGEGFRRQRRESLAAADGTAAVSVVVEFRVQAPVGDDTWLALSASTLAGPLADPVVGLIDAVAATLRWVP